MVDDNCIGATNGSFTTKAVDGNFPDWRRILPADSDDISPYLSFNGDYIASFAKMADLLTDVSIPHLIIKQSDPNAPIKITMKYREDFLGVLMGMRA